MFRRTFCVLVLSLACPVCLPAQEKAGDAKKAESVKGEGSLPPEVQNFHGQVSGTVASVDLAKSGMKVKVTKVTADTAKSKAPKPEALTGTTINVTPLLKKGEDGKDGLDPVSVAYIKGAKPGDAVTISVRASSKGVDFRLLKVPNSGRP
jgi:hypothetical protein